MFLVRSRTVFGYGYGVPVATRTTAPPKLDKDAQADFMKKAKDLMPKYRTEMVQPGPIEVIVKLFK